MTINLRYEAADSKIVRMRVIKMLRDWYFTRVKYRLREAISLI